ncbi:MAG: FtsW/RodA/SpoVE family cell cycle protein, partial [Hyphomicrobiaceae bacterium]
ISLQSPSGIRRLALVLYLASVAALVAVLFWGVEINGARRWIRIAGVSVQPAEIAKPAFVVLAAWAFAEWQRRRDMPALPVAIAVFTVFALLTVLQPDLGQTVLIAMVWGTLFVLAGLSLVWVGVLAGLALAGFGVAYLSLPYVRDRISQFIDPVLDARSQVGQAYQSFVSGGFFGRGPGEGSIKTTLPDAHNDFIFAVIAEEYGVAACLALLALFAVIVFRALARAVLEPDLANRYAVCGLALLIGYQALINMAVNVGLLPAKGMTLPMVSAGGSSIIGVSITLGMLLAISRRRPGAASRAFAPAGASHRNSPEVGYRN